MDEGLEPSVLNIGLVEYFEVVLSYSELIQIVLSQVGQVVDFHLQQRGVQH